MKTKAILAVIAAFVGRATFAAEAEIDFSKEIAPILATHCVKCHGPTKQQGGLRFDVQSGAAREGDSGEMAIVAGKPDESELIRRIESSDASFRMPSEGEPLNREEIELLRRWIDAGAVWPESKSAAAGRSELIVTEEDRQHWSFQPLRSPPVPEVKDEAAAPGEIDRFLIAALESRGLTFSPQASPRTLVRRIYFDVIGLPPTPQETADFEAAAANDSHAATAALVDRLLESRHYGERWGRHWLDVARYADSNGQEGDQDRPFAYQYRDFVIRALNEDLPFNTFIAWQVAGDELAPNDPLAAAATGFLVAGPHTVLDVPMEEEKVRNRYNEFDDMLSTLGSGMLGLTLGCARCHDHKYDPIPTRDYYRLLSALHSGERREVELPKRAEGPASDDSLKAYVFRDLTAEPKPTWLFHRADFFDKSEPVELGFLSVLTSSKPAEAYWEDARAHRITQTSTYQRAALANWITDVEHGAGALLARVIVNRVWRHHFGEGLVRTPSDFGLQGERPTHPELLEWLTHDFVANGWRLKRLHRQIMQSAAYLQDAAFDDEKSRLDPENRLLGRRRPLRLEAEILRDAMLAAAGTIHLEPYGPAFKPPIAAEAMVARNLKTPYNPEPADSPKLRRRSVYMFHKRVVPYPLLQAFDRPNSLQSCGRRDSTTVAPQALALLNDQFVRDRAIEFADRIMKEAGADDHEAAVRHAFELALARQPSDEELAASREFLNAQQSHRLSRGSASESEAARASLADFCQAVFGLNEFLYVD